MHKRTVLWLACLTWLLSSCLEPANVTLRQETDRLVVEGLLTNEANPFLRLSLTTKFGTFYTVKPLQGAYVEVRSATTEATLFRLVPNELGLYRPEKAQFAGKPGTAYSLYLKLPDGREYLSDPQTLPPPVPIDKLTAEFANQPPFGFQVYLDVKDPANTQNYYRWTAYGFHQRKSTGILISYGKEVCCDQCWVLQEDQSANVFSDALVNGSLIRQRPVFFSPFFALGKHLIEVQQYTISRQAYQYWNRYQEQRQRTGTIFDPLPAPLWGNLVNINDPQDVALGFFEVASVSRKRIEPVANTQRQIAYNLENPTYVLEGDCMLRFPFSVYTKENPPGW